MISGVFRGRATVRWPPLWPDHENFLQATLYEKVRFAIFQQELQNSTMFDGFLRLQISEKMGEFAVFIEHSEAKSVSASGSAPGPRWELRPQTPVIGSRSARWP